MWPKHVQPHDLGAFPGTDTSTSTSTDAMAIPRTHGRGWFKFKETCLAEAVAAAGRQRLPCVRTVVVVFL